MNRNPLARLAFAGLLGLMAASCGQDSGSPSESAIIFVQQKPVNPNDILGCEFCFAISGGAERGLAIVLLIYRNRRSIDLTEADLMKG